MRLWNLGKMLLWLATMMLGRERAAAAFLLRGAGWEDGARPGGLEGLGLEDRFVEA